MRANDGSKTALPGEMPENLPENAPQPQDFAPVQLAKALMRETRIATLGTLDRNTGHPMATLASVAADSDGAPILLTSGLSSHTANMLADSRVSVLLARNGKGDPLAHPRLTVLGRAMMVENDVRDRVRRRFLNMHPKAALYADFPDFRFWRLEVESGHLNGGFARAADLEAAQLLTVSGRGIAELEADALVHLNQDHTDALQLYAKNLGEEAAGWQAIALDSEGLDMARGGAMLRVWFPEPVSNGTELRHALKALADAARNG